MTLLLVIAGSSSHSKVNARLLLKGLNVTVVVVNGHFFRSSLGRPVSQKKECMSTTQKGLNATAVVNGYFFRSTLGHPVIQKKNARLQLKGLNVSCRCCQRIFLLVTAGSSSHSKVNARLLLKGLNVTVVVVSGHFFRSLLGRPVNQK